MDCTSVEFVQTEQEVEVVGKPEVEVEGKPVAVVVAVVEEVAG